MIDILLIPGRYERPTFGNYEQKTCLYWPNGLNPFLEMDLDIINNLLFLFIKVTFINQWID